MQLKSEATLKEFNDSDIYPFLFQLFRLDRRLSPGVRTHFFFYHKSLKLN